MKIERIVKYGATRSKVLFEEGLALIFYNGELNRYGMKEGSEIDDEYYDDVILPLLTARAKEKIVYILKSSDKTEAELRRRLSEGCYPPKAENAAIQWAKDKHYIDDERYTENYLRRFSEKKSRRMILTELVNKGIDKETIRLMIEDAGIDEESQIQRELIRRNYDCENLDQKEKQKLIAALMRKGYSYSAVMNAMQIDI